MIEGDLREAEVILTKAYWNAMGSRPIIDSLRRVTKAGLPYATQVITKENLEWAQTETIKQSFQDQDTESLWAKATETCLSNAEYAVDAASIVFAHSIFDVTVYEYCRVTAIAAPEDWNDKLLEKQVSLRNIKDSSYFALFADRLRTYLSEKVSRYSLIQKVDRLWAVCKPEEGWLPRDLSGYTYDRGRIVEIDQLRHDIVHNPQGKHKLAAVENDIYFLDNTLMYLLEMIKNRYGISVNPVYLFDRT